MDVERIDPEEARRRVQQGRALLVCAYADVEKCSRMALEGAIPLAQLAQRRASLPRDQEIIFYCA